jgi:hypothetical protein
MTRTLLALMFLATTAAAQPILIETIEVKTDRAKPSIIRAETRLVAGRSYTTEQLDQAIYRVRRLPFVVDASYALRPGSTPDARVLAINVIDQAMFNYDFDVQGVAVAGGYAAGISGLGLRFFPGSGALDVGVGGREFAYGGGRGVGNFGDLSAAYTAYGLFGTSVFAGAGIRTNYNAEKRIVSPMLLLGVPLTQTQTLRGSYERDGSEYENNSLLSAQWVYETHDDPYYARRGMSIAAGPQWERLHTEANYVIGRPPTPIHIEYNARGTGFAASAAKYWPLAEHSAYWALVNGSTFTDVRRENGRDLNDERRQLGDAMLGIAHNFDGWRGGDSFHRLRLELGVGYHLDRERIGPFTEDRRSGPALFAGVAYRSRVGLVHLGVSVVSH